MTSPPSLPSSVVLAASSHTVFGDGDICALEWVHVLDLQRHGERVVASTAVTDHPTCACPVIADFVCAWNDAIPDATIRTRLLAPLVPLLLDTKSTPEVERRRARMLVDWLARVSAPAFLDLAGLTGHAAALRALPAPVDVRLPELTGEESARAVHAAVSALAEAHSAADSVADSVAELAADSAARSESAAYAAYLAARSVTCVATHSAALAAYSATRAATYAATCAATYGAEYGALAVAVTVTTLQTSAQDLIRRMCEVRA